MTNAHFTSKQGQSENFLAREYYMNKLNIPVEQVVELRDRVTPWRTKNQDGTITPPMEPTL